MYLALSFAASVVVGARSAGGKFDDPVLKTFFRLLRKPLDLTICGCWSAMEVIDERRTNPDKQYLVDISVAGNRSV